MAQTFTEDGHGTQEHQQTSTQELLEHYIAVNSLAEKILADKQQVRQTEPANIIILLDRCISLMFMMCWCKLVIACFSQIVELEVRRNKCREATRELKKFQSSKKGM